MNEISEKFLPIGTVVILKGASKRVMITGFYVVSGNDTNKVYDYCGCLYPEGSISSSQVCLFNHDQIDKVFYKGYEDDEGIEYHKQLKEVIEKAQQLADILPKKSSDSKLQDEVEEL